jgi:uridine phosphorylase
VNDKERNKMEMQKDVHLSAKDMLEMVRMEPGMIGNYTIMPGPAERLQAIVKELENPAENFSYMDYHMHTGFYKGTKVTAFNGGLYSPDSATMGELACAAGTGHIIRTGSCGAIQENIAIGDIVIVTGVVRGEGTTPYYVPANFSTVSDIKVTNALMEAAEAVGISYHLGTVWTTDALLKETKERVEKMRSLKVKAVDMVSASLLTVAQLYEVKAGAILAVSDNLITGELGFVDPKYYETEEAMIDIALKAVKIMEGK